MLSEKWSGKYPLSVGTSVALGVALSISVNTLYEASLHSATWSGNHPNLTGFSQPLGINKVVLPDIPSWHKNYKQGQCLSILKILMLHSEGGSYDNIVSKGLISTQLSCNPGHKFRENWT